MTLTLPEGDFKAYLFDCDGTIADSMPLHYVAWTQALAEYGCTNFTEELFYALGGMPVGAVVAELNQRDGLAIPIKEFAHRKESLYYELIHQLQPVPEVLEQIRLEHGKIPFAVVSGSTRESVVKSLEALGLLDLFDTLVCAGDYEHGKPAPDPFLLAAARLGVDPRHCLVFEDADIGIQAATAAGMASIRIAQPRERTAQPHKRVPAAVSA
jgi:HAD superfamily hydrolase (TIGR01509 family)